GAGFNENDIIELAGKQAGMTFLPAVRVDEHERWGQLHLAGNDRVIRTAPAIGEPRESDGCVERIERDGTEQCGGPATLMCAPQFVACNEPDDQDGKEEGQPNRMDKQDPYPKLARVVDAPGYKMRQRIHLNSIATSQPNISSLFHEDERCQI